MTNSNKFYPDSHIDRQYVCDQIATLRKKKGLGQNQLAEKINELKGTNYSLKNISSWESGTALPPLTLLPTLAHILDVALSSFFSAEVFAITTSGAGDPNVLKAIVKLSKTDPHKAFSSLLTEYEQLQQQVEELESQRNELKADLEAIQKIFKKG